MTETARLLADDPIWLILIKVVGIFAFLVLMSLLTIWAERRVIGRMQHRPGPNRAGPFGLLQSLADGLKLAFKEDIRPVLADKWVYILAPVISATPALISFSVMPIAPRVTIFGEETALQLVELPVGLLVVLASASIGVYGIVLAGWASGSPYPLLGSLRSAAQVISYEIAMGLSFVAVIMYSGTLSTAGIVAAQEDGWFFALLPFSFAVYAVAMVGETNRAPFDLPEAESELVGGFHTEYSSLKFALFFLAEYVNMVTVSALATTLFLGGWHAPWPLSMIPGVESGWWPALWFLLKTLGFLFLFVWLRATLPRLRYDQFMNIGWKFLVPISLVWICAVTAIRGLRNAEAVSSQAFLFIGIGVLVVLVIVAFLVPDRRPEEPEERAPLSGGDYPVPPMDLKVPETPQRRTPVGSGAPSATASRSRLPEGGGEANSSTKEAPDGNV